MANSRKDALDPSGAVAACLHQSLPEGGKLVVGYSGGLDSTVLLHATAGLRGTLPMELRAVHVHHGLSPDADAWSRHCQSVCDGLGVPLEIARVQVRPKGEGIEAAARHARYGVYERLGANAVLLAHHQNDEAETVLLQLRRGASIRGLAAMPERRRLNDHTWLLRPLLPLPRTCLEAYAQTHELSWVEDGSNQDPSLARNQVRHALLPQVDAAIPGMSGALARAAYHFAEWADLLDALADGDGATEAKTSGLDIHRLGQIPEPRARNLLRRVLEQSGVELRHLPLIEATRQFREAGELAQVRVDFGERSVLGFQGRVMVVPRQVFSPVPALSAVWAGEPHLDLGLAGQLCFVPVQGEGLALAGRHVRVRHRQAGDRLRLHPAQARRELKDLLREAGIPPWKRPWLPIVEVDGQIAWVPELGTAAGFSVAPGETGWVISWVPPW